AVDMGTQLLVKSTLVGDALVCANDVLKGADDAAHRIQHAHRPLHDIGDLFPAHLAAKLLRTDLEHIHLKIVKVIADTARLDTQGRLDSAGNDLDQGGFATTRFTGNPIDF